MASEVNFVTVAELPIQGLSCWDVYKNVPSRQRECAHEDRDVYNISEVGAFTLVC